MYTMSTNESSKFIIKHIKYKLNEQQYIDTGSLVCCRAVSVSGPVRYQGPPSLTPEP